MKNLKNVKSKLLNDGYKVYLTTIDKIEYLRGGIISEDILKNIETEIWIKLIGEKYIFIDINNQKSIEREFDNEDELLIYIKKKFPI